MEHYADMSDYSIVDHVFMTWDAEWQNHVDEYMSIWGEMDHGMDHEMDHGTHAGKD